jgi:hypothetical protein
MMQIKKDGSITRPGKIVEAAAQCKEPVFTFSFRLPSKSAGIIAGSLLETSVPYWRERLRFT